MEGSCCTLLKRETYLSLPTLQFPPVASAVAGDCGCGGVCSCWRSWLVCELGTGTSTETGIDCIPVVGAGSNCDGCCSCCSCCSCCCCCCDTGTFGAAATAAAAAGGGGGGGGGGGDRVWIKTECVGAAGDALRSKMACAADRSSSADVRISEIDCRL